MSRRKRKMSKKTSLLFHCRKRYRQRYEHKLTKDLYNDFIDQILTNEAELISKQSNRVYIYDVQIKGNKVRLVFDNLRISIITFLETTWTGKLDLPKEELVREE